MEKYSKQMEIRWSDLDPNFHMLHSKYYDIGAFCRISFLVEQGIDTAYFKENDIGPILFREECIFKSELTFGDEISVNIKLQKATSDFSRWTMQHEIWKNENKLAAIITCDGAWMDTSLRKLTLPPIEIINGFGEIPKMPDFIFYTKAATKK